MFFRPENGGVWVAHNTVVALHATAGNHALYIQPVYATVA